MNPPPTTTTTVSLWATPRALAYSLTGTHLATTDSSGAARVFSTSLSPSASEPAQITHTHLKDASYLAAHTDSLAVADHSTVMLFSLPSAASASPEYKHLITRHTLPVTSLAMSRDGALVASGAEDNVIRLVRTHKIDDMVELRHHQQPVTGLAFDPIGTYLASVSADGLVAVWNVDQGDRTLVAEWNAGKPLDLEANAGTVAPRVAWNPTGNAVAVIAGNSTVLVLARNRWSATSIPKHKWAVPGGKPATSLAWSPNGKYLACGVKGDPKVYIWAMDSAEGEAASDPAHVVTLEADAVCIAWQPSKNTLAAALSTGNLVFVDEPIKADVLRGSLALGPAAPASAADKAASDAFGQELFTDRPAHPSTSTTGSASLAGKPRRPTASSMFDDQADEGTDGDDDANQESAARRKRSHAVHIDNGDEDDDMADASDLDDFLVDDETTNKTRKEKRVDMKRELLRAGFTEMTPIQGAFQPGATPVVMGKRYLALNMIGLITAVDQDVRTAYHIEFHDKSRMRRPVQFSDAREYTLGSISSSVAVFASPPISAASDAADGAASATPTVLHARLLDGPSAGPGAKSTWTQAVGDADEAPVALAAGDDRVVVVTDAGTARVYTVGGLFVHAFEVPGKVVCSAAAGAWCMIVYHVAAPFNGDQQLAMMLYDMNELRNLYEDVRVPLSRKAKLEWVGFSTDMIPLTFDSRGILRGFALLTDKHWTPLLDTSLHVPTKSSAPTSTDLTTPSLAALAQSEFRHSPVGCIGSTFMSILCRIPAGASRAYPPIPRPALTETPCSIASAGGSDAAWATQRFFFANTLGCDFTGTWTDVHARLAKELDKHALVQMQAMCKADKLQRALDWAKMMVQDVSVEKAIKVAAFNHLPGLGDRVRQVWERRVAKAEGDVSDASELVLAARETVHDVARAIKVPTPSGGAGWSADAGGKGGMSLAQVKEMQRARTQQQQQQQRTRPLADVYSDEAHGAPATKRPRFNPFLPKNQAAPAVSDVLPPPPPPPAPAMAGASRVLGATSSMGHARSAAGAGATKQATLTQFGVKSGKQPARREVVQVQQDEDEPQSLEGFASAAEGGGSALGEYAGAGAAADEDDFQFDDGGEWAMRSRAGEAGADDEMDMD